MDGGRWVVGGLVALLACGGDATVQPGSSGETTGSSSGSATTTDASTTRDDAVDSTAASTSSSSGNASGPIFDVGKTPDLGGTGPAMPTCKVVDDMDAIGDCSIEAPPNSFEPEVQWAWMGQDGDIYSVVTPLVANLTDDDGNGEIDLCDVPDIVVAAYAVIGNGHLYVLDGETGAVHFKIDTLIDATVCPAVGDIDGDGLVEIVSITAAGFPIAFEHDGALKWTSATAWPEAYIGALGLADLDADGDVEIYGGSDIWDADGNHVARGGQPPSYSASTAADLDDDGDLELVVGHAAYDHDGTAIWQAGISPGFPQVADLDDDPEPEVLVTNELGLNLLDHDGSVRYSELRPTGDGGFGLVWFRPATIHDFDGDGLPEYAVSSANNYSVYERDASILWSKPVSDQSGIAAGTAFDFLGDGTAEAMYADETSLFVFDELGNVLLQTPRSSVTGTEYPVVADVDNDGSAEIVLVSNDGLFGGMDSPTVQVIRDVDERWIQARRIWNQHAYHVTNVREDGTIPQHERKSWELLNTFRTNAQIEGGGVCIPQPPG